MVSAPRIPRKWRWHYRTLLALQERLGADCSGQRLAAAEQLEPHSMDLADSATDEFDHDLALSQLSAGQDALYEIQSALHRILVGSYGRCEETGRPIPAPRLRAVPWARFRVEVEARLEREPGGSRPQLGALASVRNSSVPELGDESGTESRRDTAEDESLHPTTLFATGPAAPKRKSPVDGGRRPRKGA